MTVFSPKVRAYVFWCMIQPKLYNIALDTTDAVLKPFWSHILLKVSSLCAAASRFICLYFFVCLLPISGSIALLFFPSTFEFWNSHQIYWSNIRSFYLCIKWKNPFIDTFMDTFYCMNLTIFYVKFNFWTNSTYKSTLKALKSYNFGLKAGLLSTAKHC